VLPTTDPLLQQQQVVAGQERVHQPCSKHGFSTANRSPAAASSCCTPTSSGRLSSASTKNYIHNRSRASSRPSHQMLGSE
jgi:hypothetical protein